MTYLPLSCHKLLDLYRLWLLLGFGRQEGACEVSAVGPGSSFCHLGESSSGSSRGDRPAGQVLVLPPGAQADSGFRPFRTRGEDTLFVESKGTAIQYSNDKEMKIYHNLKKNQP